MPWMQRERADARLGAVEINCRPMVVLRGSSSRSPFATALQAQLGRPLVCGLIVAALLGAASASAAEGTAEGQSHSVGQTPLPRFASLTFENDLFAGYDRHYTNGIQLAFLVDTQDWSPALRDLPPLRWSVDPQAVVAIGQRIYTPTNLRYSLPDANDRPYAGWLYLMGDVRTRATETIDHVTLSIGVVGPASLASQGQNAIHRLLRMRQAQGWNHQLGNELTLMAGYERAWPGLFSQGLGSGQLDVSPRVAATIGNVFTYASTGLVARYGRNLPDDLPVTNISLGPPRDGFRGSPAAFGWYVWLGLDVRGVARNIFIDGNTFRDSPHVSRVPYGTDVQLGIAAIWPTARIGFTMVQRSREFEGQLAPDRFGQLTVSLAY